MHLDMFKSAHVTFNRGSYAFDHVNTASLYAVMIIVVFLQGLTMLIKCMYLSFMTDSFEYVMSFSPLYFNVLCYNNLS